MVSEAMCRGPGCQARPGQLNADGLCPKCATPPGWTPEGWAAVEIHLSQTYNEDGSKKEQPPNDGTAPHAQFAHPMQPVYLRDGQPRFKPNAIVRFLLDGGQFDMNKLALMEFSREDREQFAQLIGYSVAGFGELEYASETAYGAACARAETLFKKSAGEVEAEDDAADTDDEERGPVVKYGDGRTEYGPGVSISLTGSDVAVAIDAYLVAHRVHVSGPRTVLVNGELCETGLVYVDPSGFVIADGKKFSGSGE